MACLQPQGFTCEQGLHGQSILLWDLDYLGQAFKRSYYTVFKGEGIHDILLPGGTLRILYQAGEMSHPLILHAPTVVRSPGQSDSGDRKENGVSPDWGGRVGELLFIYSRLTWKDGVKVSR